MNEDIVGISHPLPHVALVTINRPDARNAVNAEVTEGLGRAVETLEANNDIFAIVLTGSGDRAFCAGADLKAIAAGGRLRLHTDAGGFAGFVKAPREKLWIAAVEGVALAGGLEIALACDLIVASEAARFGLPEVSRGLVAAAGGLFRLPRRMPRGAALEMIATGQTIDAAHGREFGLVDHVVPTGDAVACACEIARRVATNAPIAVRESLKVARFAYDADEATLHELSMAAALRNAETENFNEGPRAFIEKREPVWRNA